MYGTHEVRSFVFCYFYQVAAGILRLVLGDIAYNFISCMLEGCKTAVSNPHLAKFFPIRRGGVRLSEKRHLRICRQGIPLNKDIRYDLWRAGAQCTCRDSENCNL